jgi:hypothetical protein
MILTRQQQEKVILDYLCESQIGDRVYGEDEAGNSTEIQWLESRSEWQIIDIQNGETEISYESGDCSTAVAWLNDGVLASMIEDNAFIKPLAEDEEEAAE